jgi:hypothetical protein|tara:strand:- start:9133 stop:9558 length:426 start_codon:yes stop_codon:yes gene_type:complete
MPSYTFNAVGPLPELSWFEERSIGVASVRRGGGYGSLRRDEAVLTIEADSPLALDLAVDELTHRGVSMSAAASVAIEAPAEVAAPTGEAPLELLDLSVKKLRAALATGDYDMYLEALLEAEQAGKTRKTAVEALEELIAAG